MESNSKSRRKTFTINAVAQLDHDYDPCNQTFVTATNGWSQRMRNETRIIGDASTRCEETERRRQPCTQLNGASLHPSLEKPSVIATPPPGQQSVLSLKEKRGVKESAIFNNKFLSLINETELANEEIEHLLGSSLIERDLKKELLDTVLIGEEVPNLDVSSSTTSTDGIFEKSSLPTPKLKRMGTQPGLGEIRNRRQIVIDEISRSKGLSMIEDKEFNDEKIRIIQNINNAKTEMQRAKQRKRDIKAMEAVLDKKADNNVRQLSSDQFNIDVKKDVIRKFLLMKDDSDSQFKCTNEQFCKMFHKGANCVRPSGTS